MGREHFTLLGIQFFMVRLFEFSKQLQHPARAIDIDIPSSTSTGGFNLKLNVGIIFPVSKCRDVHQLILTLIFQVPLEQLHHLYFLEW
jgi:hypothetical protein